MTAKEVCKRVWEISEPFAREMGVTLWDVTFEKEGGQYMLTITIDRDGHTDIDDCEKLSRAKRNLRRFRHIRCAYPRQA